MGESGVILLSLASLVVGAGLMGGLWWAGLTLTVIGGLLLLGAASSASKEKKTK